MEQLHDNLGAADLVLDAEASAALEAVSRPDPGGYPYDAFADGQRARWLKDGSPAPRSGYEGGSDHPLG